MLENIERNNKYSHEKNSTIIIDVRGCNSWNHGTNNTRGIGN